MDTTRGEACLFRLFEEGVDLTATRVEDGGMEARRVREADEREQVVVVGNVVLAAAPGCGTCKGWDTLHKHNK